MKAMILSERGAGGVAYGDIDAPDCPQGFARVQMIAASVNRVDLYMRDNGQGITHQLPIIMGVDGVGKARSTIYPWRTKRSAICGASSRDDSLVIVRF